MEVTQALTLDIGVYRPAPTVYAKQGDAGSRFLTVKLLRFGEAYALPEGITAHLRAEKPDKTGIFDPVVIREDGTLLVELTEQVLACAGTVRADICLVSGEGDILSAMPFEIRAIRAPLGKKAESSNELLTLMELVGRGEELQEAVAAAAECAEEAQTVLMATNQAGKDAITAQTAAEAAAKEAKDAQLAAKSSELEAKSQAERSEAAAKRAEEAAAGGAGAAEQAAAQGGGRSDTADAVRGVGEVPFAMVSFTDDDCRREVYHRKDATPDEPSLWELIRDLGIPYALACPPGSIYDPEDPMEGNEDYLTVGELQEMYEGGVGISCHHWRQYNMDEYESAEAYGADLDRSLEQLRAWGIRDVLTVSYPQGVIHEDYLEEARKRFRMGFCVTHGINTIPYASHRMDRYEVFPTGEAYRADSTLALAEAKERVAELAREGGWLVFMTHAWYDTFSAADLRELVRYIREDMGIPIVGINDALRATGNVVEVGSISKPLEEMAHPFFVVDAAGAVHTNALHRYDRAEVEKTLINAAWHEGYVLSAASGNLVSKDGSHRRVSVDLTVKPGETYWLSCSAVYGNAAYAVVEGPAGGLKDAYQVANTAEGEVLTDHEVVIPAGGTILRVSCDLNIQPEGWTIYRVRYPDEPEEITPAVTVERVEGGVKFTATDSNGTTEAVLEDGPQGEQGPAGPQGEQGPAGPQGEPGPAYELTNDDIKDITAEVLAALPVWTGGAY